MKLIEKDGWYLAVTKGSHRQYKHSIKQWKEIGDVEGNWGRVRILKKEETAKVIMKVRDIMKLIEKDGWYLVVTKGSHRQYKHSIKQGRVTIAGHLNDDLAAGTLNSLLKQAKLKEVK